MNVYEIVTDRILDSLSRGIVPWRKPWATQAPKNLISLREYRGINVLLLSAAHYECSYWLTYNQARGLGGTVKKGERGTPVVFWKISEKPDDKGEIEKSFLLRYFTVFNVNQCQGVQAPPVAVRPAFNPIEECEGIVNGFPDRPRIDHGGSQAYYAPSLDRVQLPAREAFSSPAEYYSTLFHELTHATGSTSRLNRKGITDASLFASHAYSFEELIAECGAAFLCTQAGIASATLDNSAAYIAHWSKLLRSEPRWLVTAASQAAKAADLILGKQARANAEAAAA